MVADELETGKSTSGEVLFPVSVVTTGMYSHREMLSALSTGEQKVYIKVSEQKKHHWLLGRMAGKRAVQSYFSAAAQLSLREIEIISGDGMPPRFRIQRNTPVVVSNYLLSLSHSHGVAVAQVVDRRLYQGVGIDVERIRTFEIHTAKSFLTKDEYFRCSQLEAGARDHAVTRHWSMKEAYLKAIGTGLRTHPNTVEVPISQAPFGSATFTVSGRCVPVHVSWTTLSSLYIIVRVIL